MEMVELVELVEQLPPLLARHRRRHLWLSVLSGPRLICQTKDSIKGGGGGERGGYLSIR